MHRARSAHTDERGISLIEVLMAISILGVISVGVLTALGTLLIGGDRARKTADLGSALVKVADTVLDDTAGSSYLYSTNCGNEPYRVGTTFAGIALPNPNLNNAGYVKVVGLEYWDGQQYSSTCPSPAPSATDPAGIRLRLQRITITAQTPDGRARRSLQFVKRG